MSAWRRGTVAAVGVMLVGLVGCEAGPTTIMPTQPTRSATWASTPAATDPAGEETSETPTPRATLGVPFPPGLETVTSGEIHAEVDGGVVRIDVAGRKAHLIPAPNLASFKSFVATPGLLAVKQVDDAVGFVIDNSGSLKPLPSELGGPGRLYAGVGDRIWVVPEQPGDGHRVLSQFGTATIPLTLLKRRSLSDAFDLPDSDLAGQLLSWKGDVPYVVSAAAATRVLPGWRKGWELMGLGPTSVLVKTCPRCGVSLRSRPGRDAKSAATSRGLKAVDTLTSAYDYGNDGQLSPRGRYLAMPLTTKNDRRDLRMAVVDLATGRTTLIPGVLTRLNPNNQVAWLDRSRDPVLLAVTDRRLRVVDAGTGKVNTWSEPGVDRVTVA